MFPFGTASCPRQRSSPARRSLRPELERLEQRKVLSLTPVPANAAYPFTAVVKVYSTFPNGTNSVGSGVLVDANHVLTAGHVVYDFSEGGYASRITVIPDLAGTSQPFGTASMIKARTSKPWQAYSKDHPKQTGHSAYDLGLITLDRDIGNETGWLMYAFDDRNAFFASGTQFATAGFPSAGGYNGQSMQFSAGPIAELSSGGDIIQYNQSSITTFEGQSGSPLVASSNRMVYGVVIGGSGKPDSVNYAARITHTVFDRLQRWREEDGSMVPSTSPAPAIPAPTPPSVTSIGPTSRSKKGITSINVAFSDPLDPSSASDPQRYAVSAVTTKQMMGRSKTTYKPLGIKNVVYDANTSTSSISLTKPSQKQVRVVIYPGIVGTNGQISTTEFSGIAP